jgi:hypothetical protein
MHVIILAMKSMFAAMNRQLFPNEIRLPESTLRKNEQWQDAEVSSEKSKLLHMNSIQIREIGFSLTIVS